uniref:Putative anti-sigma factor antagonist n=1 Tax=Streptomyces ambofaciens TaxID=1889 RepID=Q0JWK9_STRAM|nr:putative anti-sigma factor antagonist [Streptomyces ambofaciens]CAK51156.1 putative anti-sigma factor antagonist [Streptomyces ambofaciens]
MIRSGQPEEGPEVPVDEAVARRPRSADRSRLQGTDEATVVQYERCGAWVVSARGPYDMSTVTPLADALDTAAKEHPKVVLDASGITFADSALLNLLILTHQAADFRVAAPAQQLKRLLQLTAADTILKIRETVDEAAAC